MKNNEKVTTENSHLVGFSFPKTPKVEHSG